eukprot:CAMPEP_0197072262 /NCGR_PEP_ID=MMETSP1384-20130603/210008_1 /TAXON_ID=29189 /ORGANISM="Ammonia sp." /LENGTH=522 /DNA_ID=CAMNT_0042511079 /DNA_START=31 /DNA_END=1597 /DNA_ORIENTATION=-
MAEEKYVADASQDIEQSGVHFVSIEAGANEYFCERLFVAMEHFCGEKQLIEPLPDNAPEDADELDPLFDAEDFPQPFINLIYENTADIFKAGNEAQSNIIEFTFNVVFSLIFENQPSLDSNIEQLSTILSSQSDAFSRVNIKLLCLLFNTIPAQNRLRPVVMQRLLDLGKKMKSIETQELFRGRLSGLEEWIEDDWSSYVSIEDQKRLYQSASAVAAKCAEKEIYLKYLIKYLKLFNSDRQKLSKDNDVNNVVDEAAQAVIAAISSDEFNTRYVMELIGSHIVCNVMSTTPKYVELFKLLDIVYQGNVTDFEAFYKQNGQLFLSDGTNDEVNTECLGLVYSKLQRKMRLLTLCSLGNDAQSKESSYGFAELMQSLNLASQNELEELLIDGMTKKLDGTTDEVNTECLGLVYSKLQRKMRLLTLCSLGNDAQSKESSYGFAELMQSLNLASQNELEELLIDGMTKKLLYAKIDYETQQVDITRAKQRTFNKNSWQDLSNKLKLWRQNTNTVLQIIHNAGLNRW